MKVFISYRRDDSQHQADRLHQALRRVLPRKDIFIDIDGIPAGTDFVKYINEQVGQCDILLALIGPAWLKSSNAQGQRRLDDREDFVRLEIAAALNRGIVVAPVLLDNATMPSARELPGDLAELTKRNAVEIRRNTFNTDAQRLIQSLGLGHPRRSTLKYAALVVVLVVLAGAVLWNVSRNVRTPAVAPPVAKRESACGNCPVTTRQVLPDGASIEASEPISSSQWRYYCAEANCSDKLDSEGSDTPVTLISWLMADQYSMWLSKRTDRKFRLPTSKELDALHGDEARAPGEAFLEWTMTCHDGDGPGACAYYEVKGWDRQGKRLTDWHTPESRGKLLGFRVVADR